MRRSYINNLRITVRDNAAAYGYSVLITAVVSVLSTLQGSPSIAEMFVGAGGAITAFVATELIVTKAFEQRGQQEQTEVKLINSAMHFLSIGGGVGIAVLCGRYLPHTSSWACGTFLATLAYIMLNALQLTVVTTMKKHHGHKKLD